MSLTEVAVAVFGSSVLIVPIILFLAKIWFSAEIERSIKLRYDTRFEDHRRQSQTEHERSCAKRSCRSCKPSMMQSCRSCKPSMMQSCRSCRVLIPSRMRLSSRVKQLRLSVA